MIADFSREGTYKGYFGGPSSAGNSKRWQSKSGEIVDSATAPKLPYYHTYWGYEAALRISPAQAREFAPLTLAAIGRHFQAGRWLRVVREYSFSDGPRTSPYFGESVRHTVRAAELTYLLSPNHRRVSEVAWELLREADPLQQADGGWVEFHDTHKPSSLWSTIYVYRFLSKLAQPGQPMPDEREAFLDKAIGLISLSEDFLASHWRQHRWVPNPGVSWDEGAAAVLAEVGPFFSDEASILDIYHALRETLTPAGRLVHPEAVPHNVHETVYTLRLAFGLKSVGRQLAVHDTRYQRALEWLIDSIDLSRLTAYDIGFIVLLFGLDTKEGNGGSSGM